MTALTEFPRELSLGQRHGKWVLVIHGPLVSGEAESYAAMRRSPPVPRLPLADYSRLCTRRGSRAHLAAAFGRGGRDGVLCKVLPQWPDEWLGTGSQREYERAASLPLCRRCEALFGASLAKGAP